MTSELPMPPNTPKTSPEAPAQSLSIEDFNRAVEALKKANIPPPYKLVSCDDRYTLNENTITYTPTGDGGSAPRVGPPRN